MGVATCQIFFLQHRSYPFLERFCLFFQLGHSFGRILFKASLLLFSLQLQSYQFQTGVVLSNKLTFYANISMLKVKFILTLVLAAVVVVVVIVVLLLLTLA